MTDKPGLSAPMLRNTTIALGVTLFVARLAFGNTDWTPHGIAGLLISALSGFMVGLPIIARMYGHVDEDILPAEFRAWMNSKGQFLQPPLPSLDKSVGQDTDPTLPT